jgi:uncharacterized protein
MDKVRLASIITFVFFITYIWTIPAISQTFEEAERAYTSGDYDTALAQLRLLADDGHAMSQFILAMMHEFGEGVTADQSEALHWYRMAAEQELRAAQHYLGFIYEDGKGVDQDFVQAYMWFDLAATERNDAAADRDSLLPKMTSGQVEEAKRLVQEWRER